MAEVGLGELAFANGMRDDVKEFGQRMVRDLHTAIIEGLSGGASSSSIPRATTSTSMRVFAGCSAMTWRRMPR